MFPSPFFRKVKSVFSKIPVFLFARPSLTRVPFEVECIGTAYGGWYFAKTPRLQGSNAVFCGAGEDISFDVGFAAKYSADVFIVDPTPRAVSHVNSVLSRLGSPATTSYVSGGNQDPTSYDLSNITPNQIKLIKFALWNKSCILKFFAPRNPSHVSYSILNYQNNYVTQGSFLEVEARTINHLISDKILPLFIEILKLDIEGAEHEVIKTMLDDGVFPRQLLVEYDELLAGSVRGILRFRKTHKLLESSGYRLFHRDRANYSYYHFE